MRREGFEKVFSSFHPLHQSPLSIETTAGFHRQCICFGHTTAALRSVVAQKHYGMINSLRFIATGLQAVALLRFEIKQFRMVVLGKGIIKRNSSIPFIYSWARPSSGLSDQKFNLQDDERMIPRFDRRSQLPWPRGASAD